MQDNSLEKRVAFFEDVRKCRRRRQQSWETSKVAQIFTTPDEYVLVEHRAVIIRIGHLIRSTEIGLLDIFRAWNYEQSGSLNCSELYGGLEWLGMSLSPAQLHAIFRSDTVAHAARKLCKWLILGACGRIVDLNSDGLLSYEEFHAAFGADAVSHCPLHTIRS